METEEYLKNKSYANNELSFEDIARVELGHDEESLYLLVHSYRQKQTITGTSRPWENTALIVADPTDFFESLQSLCSTRLSNSEIKLSDQTNDVAGKINEYPLDFVKYNIESKVVSFQCFEDDGTKIGHQLGTATIPIAEVSEGGEMQDEENLEALVSMIDLVLESYEDRSSSVPPRGSNSEYDVFISHASEDKEEFVRPLAQRLDELGAEVWYDEFELSIGDQLRRSIDKGLANSQYGVVVLSPNFFGKDWPEMELGGLAAKEANNGKTILPIWYNVDSDDVRQYSPMLSGRVAATSDSKSTDEIVEEIYEEIQA